MSLSEAEQQRLDRLMEKYGVNDPRKLCGAINKAWSEIYYHAGSSSRVASPDQKELYIRKLSDISKDERAAIELLYGMM